MYRYDKNDFEYISRIWNMNELYRDVQRAQEDIETIKNFIAQCTEQAQKVAFMEVKRHIRIRREANSWENKVWYYVACHEVAYYDGQEQKQLNSRDNRKIAGKDRPEAFRYAQELAKKYNCPVTLEGRWPESIKPKFAKEG